MSEDATLDEFVSENDITQQDSNQYLPEIDGIPNDWRLVAVDDISTDLIGGGTPTKSNEEYWNGNIPWASVKDLNGIELSETEDHITSAGVENSTTNIIPRFSVIISTRMTVGEPFLNQIQMAINQDMKGIIPDMEKIDPLFLVYSLWDKDQYLKSLGRGTTVDGITTKDLSLTHLGLPPLEEQRKIATVLHNVDQAIQKTEEIIDHLFVVQKGLRQELFTNGYYEHDTELVGTVGQVPIGWEVTNLDDVAQVERGKFTHRPRNDPDFYGGKYPFIQTGDVVDTVGRVETYSQTLNKNGKNVSKSFKSGTILLSITGRNTGATAIATFEVYFPDSLVGITPFEEMDEYFLEQYLRYRRNYLTRLSTKTTQKNLNLSLLRPVEVIKPPMEEQRKISNILVNLDGELMANRRYISRLRTIKQALMQDLLSGKIRTTDTSITIPDEIQRYG